MDRFAKHFVALTFFSDKTQCVTQVRTLTRLDETSILSVDEIRPGSQLTCFWQPTNQDLEVFIHTKPQGERSFRCGLFCFAGVAVPS